MISQGAGFSLQLVVQEDSFRGIAAFVDVSVHVFVSVCLSTVVEKSSWTPYTFKVWKFVN